MARIEEYTEEQLQSFKGKQVSVTIKENKDQELTTIQGKLMDLRWDLSGRGLVGISLRIPREDNLRHILYLDLLDVTVLGLGESKI